MSSLPPHTRKYQTQIRAPLLLRLLPFKFIANHVERFRKAKDDIHKNACANLDCYYIYGRIEGNNPYNKYATMGNTIEAKATVVEAAEPAA